MYQKLISKKWNYNSKAPCPIIYNILNYWLNEEKNAVKINKILEENYKLNNINFNLILHFFLILGKLLPQI